MAAGLMAASGGAEPSQILAAIEVPHGPVVETLIERGFKVHAINPKQMDRFRDRFTMAGAKDDSRDAEVMASALRTDPRCFRPLAAADPIIVELREWSRIAEDLGERNRLVNRLREQLWRYFPALLELEDDLGAGTGLILPPNQEPGQRLEGPLSAPRSRCATAALRRFETSLKRLKCAKTGHSPVSGERVKAAESGPPDLTSGSGARSVRTAGRLAPNVGRRLPSPTTRGTFAGHPIQTALKRRYPTTELNFPMRWPPLSFQWRKE
jgi:hypothetical protein